MRKISEESAGFQLGDLVRWEPDPAPIDSAGIVVGNVSGGIGFVSGVYTSDEDIVQWLRVITSGGAESVIRAKRVIILAKGASK